MSTRIQASTQRSAIAPALLALLAVLAFISPLLTPQALAETTKKDSKEATASAGTYGQQSIDFSIGKNNTDLVLDIKPSKGSGQDVAKPPRYSYVWEPVSEFTDCGTSLGFGGGSWSCSAHPDSCESGNGSLFAGEGDVLEISNVGTSTTTEGVTQRGTRTDLTDPKAAPVDLGIRCAQPGTPEYEEAPPVVIIVTREDFARLPVTPLQAHAGPADGWLPVNMVNVLYVEPEPQLLTTELLDTPVAIRATATSYHWDLGDGNTIFTTNPGEPYPSEVISATYSQEGWYDITLTTTFSGQFSVDGGEWQDIDGTIEVASDPVPIYSKSLESRLVDGDIPVDEEGDPWIPARSADTEGAQDPAASHRTV